MSGVEDCQSDHAGTVKNVNPGADYLDTTRRPSQQDDRLNQVAATQHPSHDTRPTVRPSVGTPKHGRTAPGQISKVKPHPPLTISTIVARPEKRPDCRLIFWRCVGRWFLARWPDFVGRAAPLRQLSKP